MTDSFVTQCPQCQTRFKVTHQQLSVARGVVRCGHCMHVFNAARQLLEQSQAATLDPSLAAPLAPAAGAAEQATVADPSASAPSPVSVPPLPVAAARPTQADWEATTLALDALDLDQALASLERRHTPRADEASHDTAPLQARRDDHSLDDHAHEPFGTATEAPHEEPQVPFAPVPTLHEDDALEIADDPQTRTEPSLGLNANDAYQPLALAPLNEQHEPRLGRLEHEEAAQATAGLSALDDTPARDRLSAHDDDDAQPLHDHDSDDERVEPSVSARPGRGAYREPLIDVVDDPLQLDWQPEPARWGRRLLWGLLCLLALAGLGVQYVSYHFDELARQDRYRPLFQQVCPLLGCSVPTRIDVQRIKSSNLVVRSHPDFKGALIVDAIIYNRAPFSQPFPQLELRFADLNGQLIASRRFKPSEYLSGELAGRGDMPSQTPIHIALDILDPGPKAVNYSLSFRAE
ncbi:DUF3426 domain-containing protein [Pseudomonas cremoricolorata]|uniref:Zinc finger-domain-containing protein n=1 Tax=Pseudomonas cremoricolorata TaxID=157783 RepID=A0A089YBZ4_9PSED|nr:DUF3426 domain-containing protein [Pseudomonas cremoricolorata]AIR89323.1 zinc finger-domain-containing protein [Pseudomonas cremoricolorata]